VPTATRPYRPPTPDPLDITVAAGTTILTAPLLLSEGSQIRGRGMGLSIVKKSYGYGPMYAALTSQMTNPAIGGPVGDANGFILNTPALAIIDFAETPWMWYYPLDGTWWFEVQFRRDSGTGFVWGMGGGLFSTDVKVQAALAINGSGQIIAYTNDLNAGATGPVATIGQWYTCRVTVNADGSGNLNVGGTDYPISGTLRPVTVRWHDSLLLGGVPSLWPGVQSGAAICSSHVRNCKIGSRFTAPTFPLLSGNTPFQEVPGDGPGYLFIKPNVDFGAMGNIHLSDLTLDGNATYGVALTLDNCQNFSIEKVQTRGISHGVLFKNNVYSGHVHGCNWFADHTAYTARHNAHQFTALNCVFYAPYAGVAIENSYGASISQGWIYGVGPGGVSLTISGFGTPAAFNDMVIIDEGVAFPGPLSLVLCRNAKATFNSPRFQRGYAGSGAVVTIDGGGPCSFHGGSLTGVLNQNVDKIFRVIVPPDVPYETYGTDRGVTDLINTFAPDWYEAADAASFGNGYIGIYFVDREAPSGAINGVNTTFTLVRAPTVGSEEVYLNGVPQESGAGNDYTISGATITYLTAPVTGDKLRVSYRW
jgi:hypothetical protein